MSIFLAQEGAKLILWDINEPLLKETGKLYMLQWFLISIDANKLLSTVENIIRDKGGNVQLIQRVDVSQRSNVFEAAKNVLDRDWTVDILINNAGVVSGKLFLVWPSWDLNSMKQTE
jgi:short-subunit dehydrogenase